MTHTFISDIQPGQAMDGVYIINNAILRSTTRGDLYIAAFLSDKTGQVNSRMWQATEAIYNALPKPGFVHIQGRSELYQNKLQIIVNNISVVDESHVDLADYLAESEKDCSQMFAEVVEILGQVQNSQLKALIREFLNDKPLMEKFCRCPAAMKMHHNYLGGLLEHTHNMLKVAVEIMPHYPQIQPDLVLTGIFLHDMGKTEELSYDIAFSYTDRGQLVGHITQGLMMIQDKVKKLKEQGIDFDENTLDILLHIILSHHGQYDFGSPKLPATAEAFMVNYIDDLDAKINQVSGLIEQDSGDTNWTAWQHSLETKLYRGRLEEEI